jgi:transposase
VVLTVGEISDIRACGPVMAEPGPAPKVLLGDKGYDADAILEDLAARGVAAVIPPRRHRKVQPVIDGCLYAPRNLVERCFSKLKHNRRRATRYDKTADSYLGFVVVASARLRVRHFVNRA